MQTLPLLRLKKNEDRRIRTGHVWIYSNEIDTQVSHLKSFVPGQEVVVEAHDKTLLGVAYINPHSLIAARLFSRDPSHRLNLEFLTGKIAIANALRMRLYPKPYYRLVHGESDGLPGLIVDRFGDCLVVQMNTAGMDAKQEMIVDSLRAALPDIKSVLLRNDSPARLQEGLDNHVKAAFGEPPQTIRVEENNAVFDAPLWDGQKTGWFYDHRLNRSRLETYVPNKRVLDVFSYLGGWGIQAAKYGADDVTCIDSSATACEFIQSNAKLNNVSVKVICDDAFDALKKLQSRQETFAVIILDPPAFIKKQKDAKEGLIAYQRINELALKLLEPNGILISCSCSMHVSHEDLVQIIRRASYRAHTEVQILERGHQAPDHPVHVAIPETDYLKMVIVRKFPI